MFPGDPGIPKTLAPTHYNNFAPRLGLAYSPDFSDGILGKIFGGPGKSSIRASYGLYYTSIEDLNLFYEVADAPFGLYWTSPVSGLFDEPFRDSRDRRIPRTTLPVHRSGSGRSGQQESGFLGLRAVQLFPRLQHQQQAAVRRALQSFHPARTLEVDGAHDWLMSAPRGTASSRKTTRTPVQPLCASNSTAAGRIRCHRSRPQVAAPATKTTSSNWRLLLPVRTAPTMPSKPRSQAAFTAPARRS